MQHGESRATRGRSAGGEQSGQATAVLDRESAGLVYQRGGGVSAAQHCRQGEPVLQLSSRPAGEVDSEPHRRPGGGGPAPANPYTELRCRLLATHQLTDIQRVEQLFNLPPLRAQKPSKLLAEMLRLCPRGQKNNAFFNCLFLNKLPRELRILLSEAEMADKLTMGRRPQQQAGPRRGSGSGCRFFSRARRRGDHGGCNLPRSWQRATRRRWRTAGWRLERQEAGTRWRTAGVPYAEPRRAGQDREWAVIQPLLLRVQG
jgi:hypothetical protein